VLLFRGADGKLIRVSFLPPGNDDCRGGWIAA
jgi:hypothetical protein